MRESGAGDITDDQRSDLIHLRDFKTGNTPDRIQGFTLGTLQVGKDLETIFDLFSFFSAHQIIHT